MHNEFWVIENELDFNIYPLQIQLTENHFQPVEARVIEFVRVESVQGRRQLRVSLKRCGILQCYFGGEGMDNEYFRYI